MLDGPNLGDKGLKYKIRIRPAMPEEGGKRAAAPSLSIWAEGAKSALLNLISQISD